MRRLSLWSPIAVLTLAVLFPLSALAADDVGQMKGSASVIEWSLTRGGHDSITLLVQAPDGTIYEKRFHGNANPTFRLGDLKNLVDGVYAYELRVIPAVSGAVKAALAAAREAGDDTKVAELTKANGLTSPVVQSGAFGIKDGAFLDPARREPDAHHPNEPAAPRGSVSTTTRRLPGEVAADDQVIPDDLIVQGSICNGVDCVNGETFSYDTLRMKEINLRLHFDDTSSTAGYAANDWRIVANDTNTGGASYLAFEDSTASTTPFKVEAGTPSNALYVDSTGNVGLSTSTPLLDLHITTSNTPAIRLQQTAGTYPAQTWDIGGNEANFFVRDHGANTYPFRIRPGAPTSAIDIDSNGNVGVNTSSPDSLFKMDIALGGTSGIRIFEDGGTNDFGVEIFASNTSNNRILSFDRTTSTYKTLFVEHGTGAAGTFFHSNGFVGVNTASPSSRLHVTGDVRVTGGSFIDDGVTLIAPDYVFEDSYELMPIEELVTFVKTNRHLPGVPSAKDIARNGLNMSKFQMALLEKIEELTLYTAAQHEQNNAQRDQISKLMERLAVLEAQIGDRNP